MQKVLVADASEQWRELLERVLGREYEVRTCWNGLQTLDQVGQFAPDVLVMDLMLVGMDGLSVLKILVSRPDRPRIIFTGRYFSNFVTASLERYEVDYAILKPCTMQCIAGHISELLDIPPEEPVKDREPYDYITGLLVSLGVPTSQQGFRFLRSGILLLMQEPGQQLTKELYPAIARLHNTTAANVERGLRTTVATAWATRREDVWRHYFSQAPLGQLPRPTAGQFLLRLTDAALGSQRRRA